MTPADASRLAIGIDKNGNSYMWTSSDGKSFTRNPILTQAGVAHNAPLLNAEGPLPYQNKAGGKYSLSLPIDPKKVSATAASKIKDAAKAAGANPYLAAASFACAFYCDALWDWGLEQLKKNQDGSLSAVVPDPNAQIHISDGKQYLGADGNYYLSKEASCASALGIFAANPAYVYSGQSSSVRGSTCYLSWKWGIGEAYQDGWYNFHLGSGAPSACPTGSPIVNGVCNGTSPTKEVPLQSYIDSRYTGKGWDNHWAKMTAAIVAEGGNVFTDGTSVGITGPAIVPVSVSETKTGVKVLPGTTTVAPSTHTGPTEPGTQTTSTTTSAKNKFNPGPFASAGSGTAGGPATGPTMTTTQTKTITTSVTNNITNVTNITNETTTETEEVPEEAPTDTPFADLPELYKQKYPDGLIGVMRTQFTAMKATPLFSLPAQLMGDLPQTGQCPSWQLNLNFAAWANFGTRNIGADCSIWDFASWVVIISALILARQLVFGG